jgi:hypothetical protein
MNKQVLPCYNCITFPLCKNRLLKDSLFSDVIHKLAQFCPLVEQYINLKKLYEEINTVVYIYDVNKVLNVASLFYPENEHLHHLIKKISKNKPKFITRSFKKFKHNTVLKR